MEQLVWFCLMRKVIELVCGTFEGALVGFMELVGEFFCDMALYHYMWVVSSLSVLGFRYYICVLMLGVKMVATLVCLIVHTTGIVCCLYFHQACCAAEKFCSRGKASLLPENVLRIASCIHMGLEFCLLFYNQEICCPVSALGLMVVTA
jgi:hypothetical protein